MAAISAGKVHHHNKLFVIGIAVAASLASYASLCVFILTSCYGSPAGKTDSAEDHGSANKPQTDSDVTQLSKSETQHSLPPPFFLMPIFHIPVIKSGVVKAYIHLKVEMEAASIKACSTAVSLMPRLIDKVFEDLYIAISNLWIMSSDLKKDSIQERVKKQADAVLGKEQIKTVFIRQLRADYK